MIRLRIVALSTGVALVAGIAVATAATPFSGDDAGFIPDPSQKLTSKCESGIAKAVGKAFACIGKCHAGRSSGKLADDTAEDACENNNAGKSCLERFRASVAKAQSKDTTGGCGCVNAPELANLIEAESDTINGNTYCDATSGTPFGGDDTGFLPVANSLTAKCEDSVNKAVGKAVGCIIKCHISRARGKLADDTAEDTCEVINAGKGCLDKFTASVSKALSRDTSGGCNCINAGPIGATIEAILDGSNGLIFCASPSGAFVE